jgi:hypothetical protein
MLRIRGFCVSKNLEDACDVGKFIFYQFFLFVCVITVLCSQNEWNCLSFVCRKWRQMLTGWFDGSLMDSWCLQGAAELGNIKLFGW